MTYEEALQIGSKIDGYVKCTFAILYGEGGVFSMQHKALGSRYTQYDYVRDNANAYFEGGEITDAPEEYVDFGERQPAGKDYGSNYNEYGITTEYNFNILLDIPLLTATLEEKQEDGYIPCKLTAEAARIIAHVAHKHKRVKYFVYRVYDRDYMYDNRVIYKAGESALILETYTKPNMDSPDWQPRYVNGYVSTGANPYMDVANRIYHYELVTGSVNSDSYDALMEACNNYKTAVWYVRPDAIDWIPTRIDNATVVGADGKEIPLDVAIDEARKKMENAKSLLIAAGAASLIL